MKTLLVLGRHPELAETVRGMLDPDSYHVVHHTDFATATPLFNHGMVDVCLIDVESTQVQALWEIERIERQLAHCPVIVYTGAEPWDLEEEAYAHGVSHVLRKPVRGRILTAVLEKLGQAEPTRGAGRPPTLRPPAPAAPPAPLSASAPQGHRLTLKVLKEFSSILTHSLCADALLKQFLLFLREILGVNRAALFLRQPPMLFGGLPTADDRQRLRSACAVGLAPGLLDHFQLSFESGLGGFVFRTGRILRRDANEAQQDPEMLKEFQVLGAEVAIPVLDRESLLGVAVFDGRVTGEAISNDELELVFHLLEELGLTVKNIWLHEQLANNHEIVNDILQHLSSACVVVGRDMTILHSNKKARLLFGPARPRAGEMYFSDLPHLLGSKIYLSFKSGSGVAPFRFSPPDKPEAVYSVSIMPFQKQDSLTPSSVLLVAEDLTQSEQLQKLELETARLRLLKTIADRLAHEIRNALVPISIHQQMLAEKYESATFRASLEQAMAEGVKRILRLVNQMKFLAKDKVELSDSIPLEPLLEEAFQEAQSHHPVKASTVVFEKTPNPVILSGDRHALKEALAEVILNAFQANPEKPEISIRPRLEKDASGAAWVHIEIQDGGKGFSPEIAKKVPEAFFTTRNVGVGLGLTVCQKILETHGGRLDIPAAANGATVVRVSLPALNA
jgi:signal transduction histidine kinase/CheY-like chemotaxis protein